MAYHLKRREHVAGGIHRIALEQLDDALRQMRRPRGEEAVHEARKAVKKIRALLRLVQSDVDDAVFDRENAALREIGRRLSAIRDADVLVSVVKSLAPSGPQTQAFRRIVGDLVQQ